MIISTGRFERPPSNIGTKQIIVGTSRVQVSSTSVKVRSVTIKADDNNTGKVYVGGRNVTTQNGYALYPGQAVDIFIDDLSKIYLVSDADNQLVYIIYVKD